MHRSNWTTDQSEGFIGALILQLPKVGRLTGLGRPTIYQLEAERRCPRRRVG